MPSEETARSIDFTAHPCLIGVMCFTQQRLSVRRHDGAVNGLSVGAGRKAMHPSLSAQTPAAGRRRRTFSHVPDVRWWQDLPAAWRDLVVVPVSFEVSREYEIAADRTQGHDEDSEPCYCTFRYALTELRSDEDDVFYEESLQAQRPTLFRPVIEGDGQRRLRI
jgi:hypothetical protein